MTTVTPIDPQQCVNTHRIMTEWFEYPEYTPEQALQLAKERLGVPDYEYKMQDISTLTKSELQLQAAIMTESTRYKKRKWVNNMTQQEVAMRMNEASKMVSPTNAKFLDEVTQQRTGLELNPLWQMEALYRSGILNAKDQLSALKELATYTHSKAPSINHNTNTQASPEDWLLELAKDEYSVIEAKEARVVQERGSGVLFDKRRLKRAQNVQSLSNFASSEMSSLEAEVDAEWVEWDD